MSSHLTHFNGRAIGTVLQTQARLCVWYVEQDTDGRLSRRPFWGRALDYDPSRGLKVWLDGAQSEAECEWVDEGDDWEWETVEQAANRYGAVQLKLKIGDHPLCVRLPFKRPATAAPPTYASGRGAEHSGESSRPESPYAFAKKAKLLAASRAATAEHLPQQQPLHAAPHAAALQAYSAGVGAREHTQRLAQQAAHHGLDRHLDRETAAPAPFPHGMRMATSAQGYVLPYPVSQYPAQYPAQCAPGIAPAGGARGRPPNAANAAALATAAAKRAARGPVGAPAVQSAASSRPLANWNQIIIL